MWSALKKLGNKMTLWCDGLVDRRGNGRKRAQSEHVGSDSELTIARPSKRKQADKEDKVQEMVDNLKETRSSRFTPMQLGRDDCQWHAFQRRRSSKHNHVCTSWRWHTLQEDQQVPVAQALQDAVTAFASALSPRLGSSSTVSVMGTASPVRVIESRSKLYKQLIKLQNLESSGVLTPD